MEQNNQPMENSAEIKLDSESELINSKSEKKINKKIILLVIIILAIIGSGLIYFLFLNKEDNSKLFSGGNVAVIEDKKGKEVEINKELDSDQDGLPDYMEKILGTNINNSDTDGDSHSDFDEIKNGYNPLNDKKYTEEEWEVVKGMIKDENKKLYNKIFEDSVINSNNSAEINEDFSSPETTFKIYILALETKNASLYSKTLDKGSLEKMNETTVSSNKTINDSLNNIQVDIWKKADYKIFEQADRYAIMAPVFRDQQVNTPDGVLPTALLVMPDMYFCQEDNLWKIDFVTVMNDLTARMVARARAAGKETDTNLPEDEKILKQLAEDWKASFK